MRIWPRNLAGQMALLIALALFLAQAINFALLLRERQQFALQQVTSQLVVRFTDASERVDQGRPPASDERRGRRGDRARVQVVDHNPVPAGSVGLPAVRAAVVTALKDAGLPSAEVVTGLAPLTLRSSTIRRAEPGRAEYLLRVADELTVAVRRPDGRWLVQRTAWIQRDSWLVWRLAGQTLILFIAVLLPMLWAAGRIARPLRDLTQAAEGFGRQGAAPVPVRGPHDVAALIDAYNRLAARVTAMLDEKDRMLGAIGHDLRTPLAALRVRIESVEDDQDRARMADTVDEMSRTLDDILSLARLGRPSEPPTEVDMTALVDAVVEDFRDLGQPVTFAEGERMPMRLRPALMRRAVRNLIENAVKYGEEADVTVTATSAQAIITVADRGPGIPLDRLEDVFDPFTRLETSRNRETGGIGLGLALARAIVREAGGDVTLANRAGGGLSAMISLPR